MKPGAYWSQRVVWLQKSAITKAPIFYLILGGLVCVTAFNVWHLIPTAERDQARLTHGAKVLTGHLLDYEAVLGRHSPHPPHGSPSRGPISSHYGMRIHPRSGRWKMHHGVDLAVPVGTPVMVTADGWVTRIDLDPEGWGLFVDVAHPASRFLTRYAHLSKVLVRVGEPVTRGRVIARSGATGNSVGAHLHYEVRTSAGRSVDPLSIGP
ncbi:MAG: M23 family metallopeptidase [Bacteroidetes bacterium]|nr:M23 family metallopeptidase [Bacteroidota bacterium]